MYTLLVPQTANDMAERFMQLNLDPLFRLLLPVSKADLTFLMVAFVTSPIGSTVKFGMTEVAQTVSKRLQKYPTVQGQFDRSKLSLQQSIDLDHNLLIREFLETLDLKEIDRHVAMLKEAIANRMPSLVEEELQRKYAMEFVDYILSPSRSVYRLNEQLLYEWMQAFRERDPEWSTVTIETGLVKENLELRLMYLPTYPAIRRLLHPDIQAMIGKIEYVLSRMEILNTDGIDRRLTRDSKR